MDAEKTLIKELQRIRDKADHVCNLLHLAAVQGNPATPESLVCFALLMHRRLCMEQRRLFKLLGLSRLTYPAKPSSVAQDATKKPQPTRMANATVGQPG